MARFDWSIRGFALLLSLALVAAGCGRTTTPASDTSASGASSAGGGALVPVTLQLNWFPEVEHGGYYAALVHGYFRDQGLDVKIIAGGPDTPVIQQVARGAATFGIVNADNVLFGRAQEADIVALFAPLQISPRCLIVHESSGIKGFDELKDITIAMSPSSAFTHYLQHKLPLPGVRVVPYSGNVAQFLVNRDYAQQGYVFSEPFVARKAGGDPRVLLVADLGFNPYTSLLFTSAAVVRDQPELARKMVAASARGWQKYLESPDQTNGYIHQVNPEMDLDVLEFGAEAIKPLVLDEEARKNGIGTMSAARWQTLAEQLIATGQLKPNAAPAEGAYSTKFLPSPPPAD
ncbi:MAG: ABC transporter substrate-binding protein [Pirellulales bacterium]